MTKVNNYERPVNTSARSSSLDASSDYSDLYGFSGDSCDLYLSLVDREKRQETYRKTIESFIGSLGSDDQSLRTSSGKTSMKIKKVIKNVLRLVPSKVIERNIKAMENLDKSIIEVSSYLEIKKEPSDDNK